MSASMSSAIVAQFVHKMAALRVPPDSRTAVALSGGPDSLALAALVAWWERRKCVKAYTCCTRARRLALLCLQSLKVLLGTVACSQS